MRLTASTGVSDSSDVRASVEWRLSDQTSVQAVYDNYNTTTSSSLGNVGVDVRWRLEFELILHRLVLVAVVTVLGLHVGRAAAQVPLELRGRRVVSVEIAGVTAGITPERDVGIPLGVPVNRRMIRNAIRRLAESGRWGDVQIDLVPVPDGVKVVAHLTPRVLLARVEVSGNEEIDDAELLTDRGARRGRRAARAHARIGDEGHDRRVP